MEDIYMLSDLQLGKRIGEKLKAIRLKRNITQFLFSTIRTLKR